MPVENVLATLNAKAKAFKQSCDSRDAAFVRGACGRDQTHRVAGAEHVWLQPRDRHARPNPPNQTTDRAIVQSVE